MSENSSFVSERMYLAKRPCLCVESCLKLSCSVGLAAQFLLSCLYPKLVCIPLLSDFDSAGHDMIF